MARQNIVEPLADLVAWGYLTKVPRGRRKSGKFMTFMYEIHYVPQSDTHVTYGSDSDRVAHVSDAPLSSSQVTESDKLRSDNLNVPKSLHPMGSVNSGTQRTQKPSQSTKKPTALRHIASHTAASWEADLFREAEKRISNAIHRSYPGKSMAAAMEAYGSEEYERALEMEMQSPNKGANFLLKLISRHHRH